MPASLPTRSTATSPTGSIKGKFFRLGSKKKDKKREIQQLSEENQGLKIKLEIADRINGELVERMIKLVKENPFKDFIEIHDGNVHIGDINNTYTTVEVEGVLEGVENLTDKLTAAVNENTAARSLAESKLRNAEVQLKEIKSSLETCKIMLAKLDNKTVKNMGNIKSLLEGLCNDRSDEAVLKEGVKALWGYLFGKKQKVTVPASVKLAVNRIIDTFAFTNWYEFARFLNVDASSIDQDFAVEDEDDIVDICVTILGHWIKLTNDSNGEQLYNLVLQYEQERRTEKTNTYQKDSLSSAKVSCRMSNRPSSDGAGGLTGVPSGNNTRRWADPDKTSQFMHFLESMKSQVSMEQTLSDMHRMVKDIHGTICTDTETPPSPRESRSEPLIAEV
ncbi:uncharacterized protein LOC128213878 isoform X2 [Mya arenaria]|nr:uncharacterized protein LOC128213878 isoform X2 [Mya arenaria]